MIVKFLKVAKITVSTLLYLFVSILLGWHIVEHYIYDYKALYYAMWLSFGVLCGLFSYNTGGKIAAGKPETGPAANQTKSMDWTKRKDSHRIGLLVLGIVAVILAALSVLFLVLGWGSGADLSGYVQVPESRPLSITFFASVLAGSLYAHYILTRGQVQPARWIVEESLDIAAQEAYARES
jgi:amino acid transporter